MSTRILIINVSRIGDTLLGTPLITALSEHFGNELQLTCLAHPARVELLENLPEIDHLGSISKRSAPFRGWLGKTYDYAIVHGYEKSLLQYACRVAEKVIAFEQDDPALNRRLYRAVRNPKPDGPHGVDVHTPFLAEINVPVRSRRLLYRVSRQEAAWAEQQLQALASRRPLVGMVVRSFPTKPFRDWPIHSFVAAAKGILEASPNAHFILLGGDTLQDAVSAFNAALPGRFTTFAGQLSLRQSAAILAQLQLYIGVDTGPTHLAGALQIPMVSLYHCLSRACHFAPLEHPQLRALQLPTPEGGCSEAVSLGNIPPADVIAAALELLSGQQATTCASC